MGRGRPGEQLNHNTELLGAAHGHVMKTTPPSPLLPPPPYSPYTAATQPLLGWYRFHNIFDLATTPIPDPPPLTPSTSGNSNPGKTNPPSFCPHPHFTYTTFYIKTHSCSPKPRLLSPLQEWRDWRMVPWGPLMGGSPMSPVDFKKCQCPLSLSFRFSCRF